MRLAVAGGHEHVPGLDVAVHQALGGGGVQAAAHLGDDPGGVGGVDRAALGQHRAQVGPFDQLHRDPQGAVVLARVQHGHQVGMRERRGQPRLAREPAPVAVLARQLGRQQLQRHLLAVGVAGGAVDPAHSATAQLRGHQVAREAVAGHEGLAHSTARASSANSWARATSAWSMASPSRRSRIESAPTATPARASGTTSIVFGT